MVPSAGTQAQAQSLSLLLSILSFPSLPALPAIPLSRPAPAFCNSTLTKRTEQNHSIPSTLSIPISALTCLDFAPTRPSHPTLRPSLLLRRRHYNKHSIPSVDIRLPTTINLRLWHSPEHRPEPLGRCAVRLWRETGLRSKDELDTGPTVDRTATATNGHCTGRGIVWNSPTRKNRQPI